MVIGFFDTTGYTKIPKDEFWKKHDSKDDYILDVFEFCEQDPDGDVWVPSVEKYFKLLDEKFEWESKGKEGLQQLLLISTYFLHLL